MNKKIEIIDDEIQLSKGLKDAIQGLLDELDAHGWELNEDGDIVEKKSQRLVWEIYHGNKGE